MSTKSPPASPAAARRVTSPPPASPTTTRITKPLTPEKPKAATPAPTSPRASPAKKPDSPDKRTDPKPTDTEPDETIPDALEEEDVDESVFCQITEMDDDDENFSRDIVEDYFDQAATTLDELKAALKDGDLKVLSAKGHFLKGSSAALGAKKMQESCEHVQHYGAKRDEIAKVDLTEKQALRRIELIMPRLESDFEFAEIWLRKYYASQGVTLRPKASKFKK